MTTLALALAADSVVAEAMAALVPSPLLPVTIMFDDTLATNVSPMAALEPVALCTAETSAQRPVAFLVALELLLVAFLVT